MPERIYKLQPNRTLQLRGFDDLGAAAALHHATANSFKVSGVFRDPADFAVLVLYDADNFYEHPRVKYLPNFDFDGLTLSFDVHYTGLMPLDSVKFPTIDWPFLDVIRENETTTRIPLFGNATQNGGTWTAATAAFTIVDAGLKEFDRITLWYLSYPFDYLVPKVECAYAFNGGGAGTVHWIEAGGTQHSITELVGESNTALTARLATAVNASVWLTAVATGNQIDLRAKKTDGVAFLVRASSSANVFTLHSVGATTVASSLAFQINQVNWAAIGEPIGVTAQLAGASVTLTPTKPGTDGNFLAMYATSKNARLTTTAPTAVFTGGSSDTTWHVTLDFAALGIPSIRQMWLTFAPPLTYGAAFVSTEWEATFTDWQLTGPEAKRMLPVAGLDSVRVEEDDYWCTYTGAWSVEEGFYSGGFARRASAINDQVTVHYSCAVPHDLYIGTSLYTDRGVAGIRLDGDAETDLNCAMTVEPALNTRRKVRGAVPAGEHDVTIRLKSGQYFYFDFLEAAAPSDVPDAIPAAIRFAPALDYSTDHTYKMSAARLMWSFDKLGFGGPMNEYIGVFWWNQRKRVGANLPQTTVTFTGTFLPGDMITLNVGGLLARKPVAANEDNALIASHFAWLLNAVSVGVWATASGDVLTVTPRSPKPAYDFSISATVIPQPGSTGVPVVVTPPTGPIVGTWEIDPLQSPALNRGATEWHADFFAECKARNREVTTAVSMELVNPPASFAAKFRDNATVETSVGFGSWVSTHCAQSSPMRDYQKQVFAHLASLMATAQLTPSIQFGEFLWWFFTNWSPTNTAGGMGFYDAETTAAAQTALGRPLAAFLQPTDDPNTNGGADAAFLRNRLRDHVAAIRTHVASLYPATKFEVLFPYDVNYPSPAGTHNLGGALNRAVNFPVEWESKATSGLNSLKVEALDFGAWSRNLDLAHDAMVFATSLNWPRDSLRYLVPVFRAGSAWRKEYLLAAGLGFAVINLWAYDQICLHAHDVTEPKSKGRSYSV